MKHKVAELEGAQLDAAVALAEGRPYTLEGFGKLAHLAPMCWIHDGPFDEERMDTHAIYAPSTDWRDGGPIIEREELWLCSFGKRGWTAQRGNLAADGYSSGPTLLIAAMRAVVRLRFGDEVDLP